MTKYYQDVETEDNKTEKSTDAKTRIDTSYSVD